MTLANLINFPMQGGDYNTWSFNNSADHVEITAAILEQLGLQLTRYVLDPFPQSDLKGWFRRHQTVHDDMNAALGLSGSDLLDLDVHNEDEVRYWAQQHYQEHLAARTKLRI